jgi:hypothetical protein
MKIWVTACRLAYMCCDLLPIATRVITVAVGALVQGENGRKSKARVERMPAGWFFFFWNRGGPKGQEASRY